MAKDIIQITGLNKTFTSKENRVVALKHINLSIREGEIFGIIGLSGAGKSTLVRCMNMLERPTEGTVCFDGVDLATLPRKELLKVRQSIGMIFQGFNLLEQRTALKNICYPMEIAGWPKEKMLERARELLRIVGLPDRAEAYPSQLSGGQKQRIAIARALATYPKVLLCDEATSALDPNTTQSILNLLKEINHTMGVTIVIITHEMRVIERICHRVAVIDQSEIVEMGDVKEVFLRPQSAIARQLILPQGEGVEHMAGNRSMRIVFDGMSSFEPVISNMTLECRTPVNILFADTKNIDGKAFGHMILQLPEDAAAVERIKAYLESRGIVYKEEAQNVHTTNA
jgi:D-methionine transport system ATP-binding protein